MLGGSFALNGSPGFGTPEAAAVAVAVGVAGSGMERGERMAPAALALVGVAEALEGVLGVLGVFTFSASSGFVVEMLAGTGFLAAAVAAASALAWRIARAACGDCGGLFSCFWGVVVVEEEGVGAAGLAGVEAGVGAALGTGPMASFSSPYSFHSSTCSRSCVGVLVSLLRRVVPLLYRSSPNVRLCALVLFPVYNSHYS